jgi:hypothetical protein
MHSLSHCATAACEAAPADAFAVLADEAALGTWALGCWQAAPVADGDRLLRGTSLFDGSATYVRAEADENRLTVDFEVGSDPQSLSRRISARVVPGADLGRGEDRCLVTLLAWRPADMADERWERLTATHEVEVLLLQARIEAAA